MHGYQLKEDKSRAVVGNTHHSTPVGIIETDIESEGVPQGRNIATEIYNTLLSADLAPLSFSESQNGRTAKNGFEF